MTLDLQYIYPSFYKGRGVGDSKFDVDGGEVLLTLYIANVSQLVAREMQRVGV
jgi:hypothetical protein